MIKGLAVTAGVLVLGAASLLGATSASANPTMWVRQDLQVPGCTGQQQILEGYEGSSHEYQQGAVTSSGDNCEVQIIQFINGNRDATSDWYFIYTLPYYDGPTFQDQVCLENTSTGKQDCSTLY
jgi:hypothetical protein